MSQIAHLFWNDMRRLRWWFVGWLGFLLLEIVLHIHKLYGNLSERQFDWYFSSAPWVALHYLRVPALGVLTAAILLGHPGGGHQASWMTQAIGRGKLGAAKLTLILTVIATQALQFGFIVSVLHETPAALAYVLHLTWTLPLAVWVGFVAWIAAPTATAGGVLRRMGICAGVFAGFFAVLVAGWLDGLGNWLSELDSGIGEDHQHATWRIFAVVAAAGLVFLHFWHRRGWITAVGGGLAIFACFPVGLTSRINFAPPDPGKSERSAIIRFDPAPVILPRGENSVRFRWKGKNARVTRLETRRGPAVALDLPLFWPGSQLAARWRTHLEVAQAPRLELLPKTGPTAEWREDNTVTSADQGGSAVRTIWWTSDSAVRSDARQLRREEFHLYPAP